MELRKLVDGTSRTLIFAEILTREEEFDERGAWALAMPSASLLALDMHNGLNNDQACPSGVAPLDKWRIQPFSPVQQTIGGGSENKSKTPNSNIDTGELRHDTMRPAACPNEYSEQLKWTDMPCDSQFSGSGWAAPRSLHPGGVNAVQVDGSVRWVNEDIEPHLFARLVAINDEEGDQEGELSP